MTQLLNIPIQKDVPLPKKSIHGRPYRYPWKKMNVGDSIFVAKARPSLVVSAYAYGKRHGARFTSRKVVEAGSLGIRIWRID